MRGENLQSYLHFENAILAIVWRMDWTREQLMCLFSAGEKWCGYIYCKKCIGIKGSCFWKMLTKYLFQFSQLSGRKFHNKSLLRRQLFGPSMWPNWQDNLTSVKGWWTRGWSLIKSCYKSFGPASLLTTPGDISPVQEPSSGWRLSLLLQSHNRMTLWVTVH